jgi:hypothetical protein
MDRQRTLSDLLRVSFELLADEISEKILRRRCSYLNGISDALISLTETYLPFLFSKKLI